VSAPKHGAPNTPDDWGVLQRKVLNRANVRNERRCKFDRPWRGPFQRHGRGKRGMVADGARALGGAVPTRIAHRTSTSPIPRHPGCGSRLSMGVVYRPETVCLSRSLREAERGSQRRPDRPSEQQWGHILGVYRRCVVPGGLQRGQWIRAQVVVVSSCSFSVVSGDKEVVASGACCMGQLPA